MKKISSLLLSILVANMFSLLPAVTFAEGGTGFVCPSEISPETCDELVMLRTKLWGDRQENLSQMPSAQEVLTELGALRKLDALYQQNSSEESDNDENATDDDTAVPEMESDEPKPVPETSDPNHSFVRTLYVPFWARTQNEIKKQWPKQEDSQVRASNEPYNDQERLRRQSTRQLIALFLRLDRMQMLNQRINRDSREGLENIRERVRAEICRRNPDAHTGTETNPGEKICPVEGTPAQEE